LFFIWINKWVNLFTQHNTFNLILISANSHWHLTLHLVDHLIAPQGACMSFTVSSNNLLCYRPQQLIQISAQPPARVLKILYVQLE
jgi:hypothetical protein